MAGLENPEKGQSGSLKKFLKMRRRVCGISHARVLCLKNACVHIAHTLRSIYESKIMNKKLYLASGSPRRREILGNLGYDIIVQVAEIDETPHPNENAHDYVLRMAVEKIRQPANNSPCTATPLSARTRPLR
jgi:hypothetical protein